MAHAVDAAPPTSIQPASDTYRLVILDGNGAKVRVVLDGDRYALPSMAVPRWQRIAENLTDAVKTEWGEEVVCLFPLDTFTQENGSRVAYEVVQQWRTNGTPRSPMRWALVSDISQDSLADHRDYAAIGQSVTKCKAATHDPTRPFARLDWFTDLCDWVRNAVKARGLRVNGNFRQLNASPSFSLVRFETDGPAVWFKAVGEPNQREFPITCTLAELFPNYLPPVLGVQQDWNGWLTREAEGRNLREAPGDSLWEQAASALANLQIESIDNPARVLSAGARDQRTNALSESIHPFMEAMGRLMEQQTKSSPAILSGMELLLLGTRIASSLDALLGLGIPDALGHSDLNPGNIIVSDDSCSFLDWAETYVGNPFFSFQYLREHFRHRKGASLGEETQFIESYCLPWRQVLSPAAIRNTLGLTSLLAVFANAVGSDAWRNEKRFRDQATAGYLRSLTRRMNRESCQSSDRRLACLC